MAEESPSSEEVAAPRMGDTVIYYPDGGAERDPQTYLVTGIGKKIDLDGTPLVWLRGGYDICVPLTHVRVSQRRGSR
jgi:hypothetical protein